MSSQGIFLTEKNVEPKNISNRKICPTEKYVQPKIMSSRKIFPTEKCFQPKYIFNQSIPTMHPRCLCEHSCSWITYLRKMASETVTCCQCNANLPVLYNFCTNCGAENANVTGRRGNTASGTTCQCGCAMPESDNFCTRCGTEKDENRDEEITLIRNYFQKGFEYETIVALLAKHHGINMCIRTLKSRLKEYGLRRRMASYNVAQVFERIRKELDGPGCMGGYRSIWLTLKMDGFQVPRHDVEEFVRQLDPESCELRRAKRLKRRKYRSPGPNHCWHIDGYDKLKPFGFPIHGCVDGWSRKIMWLKVARSNNNPAITASFFIECVREFNGCPVKVRSDCGTENGVIAAMQCEFRGTSEAHVFGTSPANQRIEGWWSYLRRARSTWWINYFKDLVEKELFHPGNEIQGEALWYCFSKILQRDLDRIKEHWNAHRIRRSRHDTIPGRPDELFSLPENHGGTDGLLLKVSDEKLQYVTDHLLEEHIENSIYKEYFDYLIVNSELEHPNDWKEAEELYIKLNDIAAQ